MNWAPVDVITTDRYLALENKHIAYIKTDVLILGRAIYWRGRPHTMRPAKLWITGHSDYSITDTIVEKYGKHCIRWATINNDTATDNEPSVISLPLGITNDCADSPIHKIYGNIHQMWEASRSPQVFRGLAYANFVVDTYPKLRAPLMNKLSTCDWVTVGTTTPTLDGRRKYLDDIRNHKFTFCPRGNGIDTHRLWETLYVGGIPIVVRHRALRMCEDLPICWVDDLLSVTPEFLESEFIRIRSRSDWAYDKLKFGYWQRLLESIGTE
jgi:hypothetical protein